MTQLDSLEGYYFEADEDVDVEVHNRYKDDSRQCCYLDKTLVEYCTAASEWVFETSYNGEDADVPICSAHCNI